MAHRNYARGTLTDYLTNIRRVYEQCKAGPVPYEDPKNPEAPNAKREIDKIVSEGIPKASKEPTSHEDFRKMVTAISINAIPTNKEGIPTRLSELALCACLCIVRGAGCRAADACKVELRFIKDNLVRGVKCGMDIFFPEEFALKNHIDVDSRRLILPEVLADETEEGFPLCEFIRSYLPYAPKTGSIFQMCAASGSGHWNGKPWTTSVFRDKMGKLALQTMPERPKEYIKKTMAPHNLRVASITGMGLNKVNEGMVARAHNQKRKQVTSDNYFNPSVEFIRASKGLTENTLTARGGKK